MTNEIHDTGADRFERRTFLKGAGAATGAGLLSTLLPETAAASTAATGTVPDTATFGANMNGWPRPLNHNMDLVDASNTTWVRAFFDIRKKNHNGIHPKNDPDVVALRRAKREKDCKLIVSLLWDFKGLFGNKSSMNVPRPGSRREVELRRCATRYLRNIGVPVDVVVLGNEPMWETKREDVRVENPPIVRFTRNVKDHLIRHGDHGNSTYLVGSLNRLDDDVVREEQYPEFFQGMFDMARYDDDVDGVDLHIHYEWHREAREMVKIARNRLPNGVLTATEFSPVYRYERGVTDKIRSSESGREFLREYDHPWDWTALDYFDFAKNHPRPRSEFHDFYDAMPWYWTKHLQMNHRLFERFDVSVATLGFLLGPGMRDTHWGPNWKPFPINHLFQSAMIQGRGDHPHFFDEYRLWA